MVGVLTCGIDSINQKFGLFVYTMVPMPFRAREQVVFSQHVDHAHEFDTSKWTGANGLKCRIHCGVRWEGSHFPPPKWLGQNHILKPGFGDNIFECSHKHSEPASRASNTPHCLIATITTWYNMKLPESSGAGQSIPDRIQWWGVQTHCNICLDGITQDIIV